MKIRLAVVITAVSLSGCAYYPHKVMKENTGLEFGNEVNLCPSIAVESQKTCRPNTEGWSKANKIAISTFDKNANIFEKVINNYIGHRIDGNNRVVTHQYDLWGSSLNNPKTTISSSSNNAQPLYANDYFTEAFVPVLLAELFEKEAVENAVITLTTEAEAHNIQISGDFIATVKSELQKRIRTSKSSTLSYHFIRAEYLGKLSVGEDDEELKKVSALNSALADFNSGKRLITGVSGIVFGSHNAEQTVVEESMLISSIDAALSLSNNRAIQELESIKVSIAAKWSSNVNKKIRTSLSIKDPAIYFYPLWVRTVSKGDK